MYKNDYKKSKKNSKKNKRKFYAVFFVNENAGCIYLDYNLCKKSIKNKVCIYRYFYRLYDALQFLDEKRIECKEHLL